jgi:Kelch motif
MLAIALSLMVAVAAAKNPVIEALFDFSSQEIHQGGPSERSRSLGGFVSLAQTGTAGEKKTSYPPHKWTLLKKYPDDFKLKGASMVSFEDKLIIFGGCKEDLTCSNSIYAFDTIQEKLEEIVAIGDKPAPRQGHCVIAYGEEMIVFGGSNEIGVYDDLFVFDMKYVKCFDIVFLEEGGFSRSKPWPKVLPWMCIGPKSTYDHFRRLHSNLL